MTKRTVRIGVVGAGTWGAMHARAYQQHAGTELVGICDLDEDRASALAARVGGVPTTPAMDELLEMNLDGISIATPDAAHTAPVLKAAAAGVHILVEKPLATTVEDCQAMIEAARRNHVVLMVDWHNRWNPPAYEAWTSVRAGELGAITYIYYRLSDTLYVPTKMLPWAGTSSVLHFLGSHALDTICWLLDQAPIRVTCRRKEGILSGMGIPTADMYVTILDFPGGATAVVENAWILPRSAPALIDHRWEIIGDSGVLNVDATHNRAIAKYTRKTPAGFPNASFPDMFVTPEVHGRQLGFCVEPMYHFADCLRTGAKPLTSGEDGLLNTRILIAAEASARTGAPVDLPGDEPVPRRPERQDHPPARSDTV